MQVCEKVGKSRFTVFFQWYVAPEGRKIGPLKRQVRSHVVRWQTTPQLQLHYVNCSCTTPHYIQQLWVRWPLQPLQPLQKTQLQPPFSPSVDSLCHPWFTTTNLSYGFPILKLPPEPCAGLLEYKIKYVHTWYKTCVCIYIYIFTNIHNYIHTFISN